MPLQETMAMTGYRSMDVVTGYFRVGAAQTSPLDADDGWRGVGLQNMNTTVARMWSHLIVVQPRLETLPQRLLCQGMIGKGAAEGNAAHRLS